MVPGFHRSDVPADFFHNAGPFVSQYRWWRREGNGAIDHREITVADAAGGQLDQDLSTFGFIDLDLFDLEGCVVLVEHCCFHGAFLLSDPSLRFVDQCTIAPLPVGEKAVWKQNVLQTGWRIRGENVFCRAAPWAPCAG